MKDPLEFTPGQKAHFERPTSCCRTNGSKMKDPQTTIPPRIHHFILARFVYFVSVLWEKWGIFWVWLLDGLWVRCWGKVWGFGCWIWVAGWPG